MLIRKTTGIETGHVDRAEKLVDRFANNVTLLNRALREKYGADLTNPPEDIAHRQSMLENPNLGKLQGALNLSQDSGSSSKGEQVKLWLLNVHFFAFQTCPVRRSIPFLIYKVFLAYLLFAFPEAFRITPAARAGHKS